MCDCESSPADELGGFVPSRRQLLRGAVVSGIGLAALRLGQVRPVGAAADAVEVMPGLSILPRDAWGHDLPPKGALTAETPWFLLVHHTASANSYSSARAIIRSTYA